MKQANRPSWHISIKKFLPIAIVLAVFGVAVYLTVGHMPGALSPANPARDQASKSHNTGRVLISFKDGTSYQQAQEVLNRHKLTNTRSDFMQLYITVNSPVNIQSSSISELNTFYATLDKIKQSRGVSRLSNDNTHVSVYFDPTVDEATARQILTSHNLTVPSGASFRRSYEADVEVPVGQEPRYINALYGETSVSLARESIITTN